MAKAFLTIFSLIVFFAPSAFAESESRLTKKSSSCTLAIQVKDTIGPATYDYLQRAQKEALDQKCTSIFARINTPGGNLQSTRKIVELIMNSPIPYLCLVAPAGGHAGSAGAIIMQACHWNGALPATNLGAATPIQGSGQELSKDLRNKIVEDTRSWVESLAQYHGRSKKFAADIVLKAKALAADQAFKEGAIDQVASSPDEFLKFAEGKKVRLAEKKEGRVSVGELLAFDPGLRHDVLQILSNPQWAYLIFMGSLGLLYFEMTHPGGFLPGVVGAMGLVISLMNFHMLDVSWGGILLILLGVGFMFAELFVPSFGALGFGGVTAFVVGSLFLFDENSGYHLPLDLLIATSLVLALIMGGISFLAMTAYKKRDANREKEKMEGKILVVKSFEMSTGQGMGQFKGELWKIKSEDKLSESDEVVIAKVDGLTLEVKKRG